MKKDALKIIYGDNLPQPIKISFKQKCKAIKNILAVYTTYKKHGLSKALDILKKINESNKKKCPSSSEMQEVFSARIFTDKALKFKRTFFLRTRKTGLCLENALVVASALITLGFPIDLIIGREMLAFANYNFHAWLELNGEPILAGNYTYEFYTIVSKIHYSKVGE